MISPLLDERQRRVVAGATARLIGRGGITAVARAADMSRNTVMNGAGEIETGEAVPQRRVRRVGGGRKQAIDKDPNLLLELDGIWLPRSARGDPMSPLRWTSKSTYKLADALRAKGFDVGPTTVRELLHEMGYSLQGTSKQKEGAPARGSVTPSSTTSTTRRRQCPDGKERSWGLSGRDRAAEP